jgi:hypothetical protein
MKSVCSFGLTAVVALASLAALNVGTAHARKQYSDEFVKTYITDSPSTPAQKAIEADVKAVKCGVCHVGPGGSKKKERNAYGAALQKQLEKNEKDTGKIKAGLEAIAKDSSNPADAKAPTFGDLLKEGKLPAPAEKAAPAADN